MSTISSTASAAAAPIVDLFNHGHKKAGKVGSGTDASASDSTQGPATTQGLFSRLLESLEQVIGVSLTAPASATPATTAATAALAAVTSSTAATAAAHAANTLGANINAKA